MYTLCSPLPLHSIVSFGAHFFVNMFFKDGNQNKAQIKRHTFHSHTSPLHSLKRNICKLDALHPRCISQFHLLRTFLLKFCTNSKVHRGFTVNVHSAKMLTKTRDIIFIHTPLHYTLWKETYVYSMLSIAAASHSFICCALFC